MDKGLGHIDTLHHYRNIMYRQNCEVGVVAVDLNVSGIPLVNNFGKL